MYTYMYYGLKCLCVIYDILEWILVRRAPGCISQYISIRLVFRCGSYACGTDHYTHIRQMYFISTGTIMRSL